MLQSLKIENFKGFKELHFPCLKRVNLITGKNNTGKTGVLEALLLLIEGANAVSLLPMAFRNCAGVGNQNENFWKWFFYNHDTSQPAKITADTSEYSEYGIALSSKNIPSGYVGLTSVGEFSLCFQYPVLKQVGRKVPNKLQYGAVPLSVRPTEPQKDATDFDRVVLKAGGEERLESLLRKIEPRLKTVRSIKPHGAFLLYVDMGLPEKMPAIHFGQGFLRLLSIYSEIIASGKKVLLIDEFENGLHHSVLIDIWRGILEATEKEGLQVFATTHSYECIRAAHAAFAETIAYDFALHRLDEVKGQIKVVTYDKETLETSLASGFETR